MLNRKKEWFRIIFLCNIASEDNEFGLSEKCYFKGYFLRVTIEKFRGIDIDNQDIRHKRHASSHRFPLGASA